MRQRCNDAVSVRSAILVLATLLAAAASAQGATTNWQGAVGTPLPWNVAGNWTAGLPAAGSANSAYITNGGIATIVAGNSLTAGNLYMGTGSDLAGQVTQSGGALSLYQLYLCAPASRTSMFTLSGGTLTADTKVLSLATSCQVGGLGTNTFRQTGGTFEVRAVDPAYPACWSINAFLIVGQDGMSSTTSARYELSGSGILKAPILRVGTLGYFDQSGGTVTSEFFSQNGTWKFTGGSLTVNRGFQLAGTLDFNGAAKSVTINNAVADLTQATILNGANASFTSGPKSLVLLRAGFNTGVFGAGWSPGNLVHTVGAPLSIAAGQGFEGWGNINDHVTCAGTIDAGVTSSVPYWVDEEDAPSQSAYCGKGLNLNNGLNVLPGGSVDLRIGTDTLYDTWVTRYVGGNLTVHDLTSGMTGGTLKAETILIGTGDGAGTFTHTAGTNTVRYGTPSGFSGTMLLGYKDGSGAGAGTGTYLLSGTGVLSATKIYLGYDGAGYFTQTGGSCRLLGDAKVGFYKQDGHYDLSGGTLETGAGSTGGTLLYGPGPGKTSTFVQSGGIHDTLFLYLNNASGGASSYTLSGTGQLDCVQTNLGSAITNSGQVTFTQTGGTHNGGFMTIGYETAVNARYLLQGGVYSGAGVEIGGKGTARFEQTGGTATLSGTLDIGHNSNGSSFVSGLTGVYTLASPGQLTVAAENIGYWGVGTFTHTGGNHAVTGNMTLGRTSTDTGTYTLSGAASQVTCGSMTLADAGIGTFTQTGGLADAGTLLAAGKSSTGNGTFNLSGASSQLWSDEARIGEAGTGKVVQSAGYHVVAGPLTLGYASTGKGTYEMSGGMLGAVDLVIGRDSGTSHGTGTFKVTNAAADITVAGSLHLGVNGTLDVVPGTVIHMTGSTFENASTTPSKLTGLANLTLVFEGGPATVDTFEVAGRNYGRVATGFSSNFALDTLQVGGEQPGTVQLVDLVDNQPAWTGPEVLYVENLVLGSGSTLDLGGCTVYYLNLVNQGGTVVANGGSLMPLTVAATATLNYDWVYQNTPTTTAGRHVCLLTISVTDDPFGNTAYATTVTQNAASTGRVTPVATANPLVWTIVGGQRDTDPVGAVTLDVTVTGVDKGGAASATAQLTVRQLGDVDGDGLVNASDKLEINKCLNGLATLPGITLRDLDLTGDSGQVNTEDKLAINQVLNGLIVP